MWIAECAVLCGAVLCAPSSTCGALHAQSDKNRVIPRYIYESHVEQICSLSIVGTTLVDAKRILVEQLFHTRHVVFHDRGRERVGSAVLQHLSCSRSWTVASSKLWSWLFILVGGAAAQ